MGNRRIFLPGRIAPLPVLRCNHIKSTNLDFVDIKGASAADIFLKVHLLLHLRHNYLFTFGYLCHTGK